MKSFILPMLALALAAAPAAAAPLVTDDIGWRVSADAGRPRLTLSRDRKSTTSFTVDQSAEFQPLRDALGQAGRPVRFTLRRDAGTVVCSGTTDSTTTGRGRCRFTSNPSFEDALAKRRLPITEREPQLTAMAFLNTRLAEIDNLIREGMPPQNVSDVIAASALGVSGAYVRDLKSAGLAIRSFDDLIACRALKIDGAFVREIVAAGYPRLTSSDVIPMKAVGVNGRFVREINAGKRSVR